MKKWAKIIRKEWGFEEVAREREIAIKGEKDRETDKVINQRDHRALRDRNKSGKNTMFFDTK